VDAERLQARLDRIAEMAEVAVSEPVPLDEGGMFVLPRPDHGAYAARLRHRLRDIRDLAREGT
jgi:hypothetical protein